MILEIFSDGAFNNKYNTPELRDALEVLLERHAGDAEIVVGEVDLVGEVDFAQQFIIPDADLQVSHSLCSGAAGSTALYNGTISVVRPGEDETAERQIGFSATVRGTWYNDHPEHMALGLVAPLHSTVADRIFAGRMIRQVVDVAEDWA